MYSVSRLDLIFSGRQVKKVVKTIERIRRLKNARTSCDLHGEVATEWAWAARTRAVLNKYRRGV